MLIGNSSLVRFQQTRHQSASSPMLKGASKPDGQRMQQMARQRVINFRVCGMAPASPLRSLAAARQTTLLEFRKEGAARPNTDLRTSRTQRSNSTLLKPSLRANSTTLSATSHPVQERGMARHRMAELMAINPSRNLASCFSDIATTIPRQVDSCRENLYPQARIGMPIVRIIHRATQILLD